jgi:hypothetical protein
MTHRNPGGMDPQTVRQLAQQLARWATDVIERGRTPFRRAEIFPRLCTAVGTMAPPLVLWINRDSYMAGGVIFFPVETTPETLDQAAACAAALGLNIFTTWGAREITYWQFRDHSASPLRSWPLIRNSKTSTADFHDALLRLMEDLKAYSVLGALPAGQMPPCYLANLYQATLAGVIPMLTADRHRHGIAEYAAGHELPSARDQAGLTLGRLLALLQANQLPSVIAAGDLERVLVAALPSLDEPLQSALRRRGQEPALPEPCQVRFHLLLHRLRQLDLSRDRDRAAAALEILLQHQSEAFGGRPLPASRPAGSDATGPSLFLFPDAPPATHCAFGEAIAPALSGLLTLLRQLRGQSQPLCQVDDPLCLPGQPAPSYICGTLDDGRMPLPEQRRVMTTQLRISWPARRFRLPPKTPRWAWQLLHVLGLAAPNARLTLVTPDGWLASDFGRLLLQWIQETGSIMRLRREPGRCLQLDLIKRRQWDGATVLEQAGRSRSVPWADLLGGPPILTALYLELPESLYLALREGRLCIPEPAQWPAGHLDILQLFIRSKLGRYLWQQVGGGRALPRRGTLEKQAQTAGLPLPHLQALKGLQRWYDDQDQGGPDPARFEGELAVWLPGCIPPPSSAPPPCDSRAPDTAPIDDDQLAMVAQRVFLDGVPRFPEQYLYDYYRPDLQHYEYRGALQAGAEFFGCIELQDTGGRIFKVQGRDTARALLLISACRPAPVQLPTDPRLVAAILGRYLTDLQRLRRDLLQALRQQFPETGTTETLADQIWMERGLPPWSLVQDTLSPP